MMPYSFSISEDNTSLKEPGWTQGELILGKKLKGSTWIQSFSKLKFCHIENIWAQVHLRGGDKRTDFLVFTDKVLYVIEVKDFKKFDHSQIQPWEKDSGWHQCHEYVMELREMVGGYLTVVGILAFPFLKADDNPELADAIQKHGQDKFKIDCWFDEEIEKSKMQTLLTWASDKLVNPSNALDNYDMLCAMQALVSDVFTLDTIKCRPDLSLHVLEKQQTRISHNLTSTGDRIIYGVAGSGKTIIIIKRAKRLAKNDPDFKILVTCYNKPLSQHLKNELYGHPNIEVKTIFAWYRSILQRWGDEDHQRYLDALRHRSGNLTSIYFDQMPNLIEERLEEGKTLPLYDAILVDEGQDFEKKWLYHLKQADLERENGIFLVCLDSLQAIHKRQSKSFNWSEIGIQARGRTQYLRKNYRNRKKIGEYAISKLTDIDKFTSYEEEMDQYLEVEEFLRPGGEINTIETSPDLLLERLAESIQIVDDNHTCMILYDRVPYPKKLEDVNELLKGKEPPVIRESITSRNVFVPTRRSYPIYSVYRSKGLEADTVIFVHDRDLRSSLGYVAITRAREKFVDIVVNHG